METEMDKTELPKLPENQKSFAGIPEAVFVVSLQHNLKETRNPRAFENCLAIQA